MKNAYVNVRVDSEVKKEVERILEQLGINTSTAIDLYFNQILLKDGLPFEVKLPGEEVVQRRLELAAAINLTAGKEYPSKFNKILSLYANGEIDYDVALYAVKKEFVNA